MNSRNVWLRWVREGSAYTITKSRRKAVRRERLRIVSLFWGYTILLIEQKHTGICFDYKRVKKCRKAELKTPYAGAMVRRVFKEIETKLREAAR